MQLREQATRTALVVEDNNIQQKVLKLYLEQLSYQVEIAECADAAIKLINTKSYTVILMDLGLPDQPGETVIGETRKSKLNHSTPIIVCTAHATEEKKQYCLKLGANKILIKPVQLEILEQAIKDVFKQIKKPSS